MSEMPGVLLDVQDVKKHFQVTRGALVKRTETVKAVDGVSLSIRQGETFGLVGESGCGKTTLGRLILRLLEPTSGRVVFGGRDLCSLSRSELRTVRRELQIVFQDPYASLNPRMTVAQILGEPLVVHTTLSRKEREQRVCELLGLVGLEEHHRRRYPHEFSGGQRQRIGIARALALNPRFIVCDEPVSALDVSIQSQILNLLEDLQERFALTYLFVAHDLSVIRHISDTVGVMYLGKLVEMGPCEDVYDRPAHPYTRALMEAIPVPDPRQSRDPVSLPGEMPSPFALPSGCRFHTRCPMASAECSVTEPAWRWVDGDHYVACHEAG